MSKKILIYTILAIFVFSMFGFVYATDVIIDLDSNNTTANSNNTSKNTSSNSTEEMPGCSVKA